MRSLVGGSHRKSIGNDGPTRLRPKQRKAICRKLKKHYGNRCYYCTRTFEGDGRRGRTLDHLIPLSRGGTHEMSNLVLACSKCNGVKGDMTWWEYFATDEFRRRREDAMNAKPERPARPKIEVIRFLRF